MSEVRLLQRLVIMQRLNPLFFLPLDIFHLLSFFEGESEQELKIKLVFKSFKIPGLLNIAVIDL